MDCERRIAFRAGRHYEVLMNFQLRDRWAFHFIAADCKTPISSFFSLRTLDELRALVIRTEPPASMLEEFDRNVRAWGRGSVTLFVTAKQLVSIIRGGRR